MSIKAYNEERTNKDGSVAVTQLQNKKVWMTYSLGEVQLKKCNEER